MIISRTPIRISLVGGSTDIANFYRQYGGEVISTAIDKYITVRITRRRNSQIAIDTLDYRETVSDPNHIQHALIREAMRKTNVPGGVSITVTSDIPSRGCGLGSSSALTVGLLNAFYAYQGIEMSTETLAQQACEIEIERLNQPIGKQDQYIAAYGGLRRIQFNRDESVHTQDIPVTPETVAIMEQNFTLFYTGIQRRAETILNKQIRSASPQTLLQIKELVPAFYDVLVERNHKFLNPDLSGGCPYKNDNGEDCLCEVGYLLDRGWQLKRSLCDSISNPMLDTIYERAVAVGALGGKILGAGGGGYFLFYVPKAKQGAVTAALSDLGLSQLRFCFEQKGTQIIEDRSIERFVERQPPQVVDKNSLIEISSLR